MTTWSRLSRKRITGSDEPAGEVVIGEFLQHLPSRAAVAYNAAPMITKTMY
jgi:hypothetical protein